MATSPLPIFQDVPKPGDRRRSVRHNVHSPAYASFGALDGGMALDVSEIRDISPEGMSLHFSSALPVGRSLNIVLDLSETKTYIDTTGTVIWSEPSGRCGLRFGTLSEASLRQLNSWLLFNTLTALTKTSEVPEAHEPVSELAGHSETALVADAPTLNQIRSHLDTLSGDPAAALDFLADRARMVTRASGAAIAISEGEEMVCRASSGEAPRIGAHFHVGSGFSGECVRTAKPQRCDDAENNALVDRASCRALGIRSLLAVPIFKAGAVVGIVEVFSPHPYAFEESDRVALGRLADIATRAAVWVPGPTKEPLPRQQAATDSTGSMPRETILLIAGIFLIVLAIGASVTLLVRTNKPAEAVSTEPAVKPEPPTPAKPPTLQDLRHFADTGDPVAQFALGARYAQGDEVKQDYGEAVRWFQKAANQGHVVAQATLGAYYWAGRGVPEDLTKAYFWSLLARAGGDEASKYRVAALSSRMTHLQVLQAEQQANDWLRQHQQSPDARLQR